MTKTMTIDRLREIRSKLQGSQLTLSAARALALELLEYRTGKEPIYVLTYVPGEGPARIHKQSVCLSYSEVYARLGLFLRDQTAEWTAAERSADPNIAECLEAIRDERFFDALTLWNSLYDGGDRIVVTEHSWDAQFGCYATLTQEWS